MGKQKDKAAALDHVLYEIEMLANALITLTRPNLSALERNVWIEVFAVHARNLNEFFCKKDFGKSYMKPSHFVLWQYDYTLDNDLAKRASAHVTHLTYDREVPGKKTPWLVDNFFIPLQKQSIRFLNSVSQNESLMLFQNNRTRTAQLSGLLLRIHFEGRPVDVGS